MPTFSSDTAPDEPTVGWDLRQAREARGWTVEYFAKRIRLRPDQIRDLEADDYRRFGGWVYVRSSVRLCSRQLDLDADALLDRLEAQRGGGADTGVSTFEQEYEEVPVVGYRPERAPLTARLIARRWGMTAVVSIGALMALMLVVLAVRVGRSGVWKRADATPEAAAAAASQNSTNVPVARAVSEEAAAKAARQQQEEEARQARVQAEQEQTAPVAEPVSAENEGLHLLRLEALDEASVRILGEDLKSVLFEGKMQKGEWKEFKSTAFQIRLQNPGAVQIFFDGSRIASPADGTDSIEMLLP